MAEPMMKEDARPSAARRDSELPPGLTPQGFARAKEMERKLGRPLRMHIDGPLTEEEEREVIFARMMYDKPMPLEKLLEDFKHLRKKR